MTTKVSLDMIAPDLRTDVGAAQIGATGDSNVQAELNARPTSATLSGATGSGLLGYISAGLGAVAQTVLAKLRRRLDAEDFFPANWVPASTDVTSQLQAAINWASSSGRTLYLPAAFRCGALTVPAGTAIVGVGKKTVITPIAGTYNLFTITGSDCSIENVLIEAAAKTGGWEFVIACGTSVVERLLFRNINIFNSFGGFTDSGSTGFHVTTRFQSVQVRGHRGPGVSMTRLFAFSFWNEVVIDYNGSASADFTGFSFDLAGLGADAGGLIMRDCDVLGTTSVSSVPNQRGWYVANTAAVWLIDCRADGCGGKGLEFNNVNKLHLVDTEAGLCNNHGFEFTDVINSSGTNLRVFGRNGISGAAANIDGIRFVSGCGVFNITGVISRDNTGHGINKAAAQGGAISIMSPVCIGNGGRGIRSTGNSSFVVVGGSTIANTAGNYDLGGNLDYGRAVVLNSGVPTDFGPGPVTG